MPVFLPLPRPPFSLIALAVCVVLGGMASLPLFLPPETMSLFPLDLGAIWPVLQTRRGLVNMAGIGLDGFPGSDEPSNGKSAFDDLYKNFEKWQSGDSMSPVPRYIADGLYKCAHSDARCLNLLGDMYFQGVIADEHFLPSFVKPLALPSSVADLPLSFAWNRENESSPGKSSVSALLCWQAAARLGSGAAQYSVALFYATFYNAPSEKTATSKEIYQRFNDRKEALSSVGVAADIARRREAMVKRHDAVLVDKVLAERAGEERAKFEKEHEVQGEDTCPRETVQSPFHSFYGVALDGASSRCLNESSEHRVLTTSSLAAQINAGSNKAASNFEYEAKLMKDLTPRPPRNGPYSNHGRPASMLHRDAGMQGSNPTELPFSSTYREAGSAVVSEEPAAASNSNTVFESLNRLLPSPPADKPLNYLPFLEQRQAELDWFMYTQYFLASSGSTYVERHLLKAWFGRYRPPNSDQKQLLHGGVPIDSPRDCEVETSGEVKAECEEIAAVERLGRMPLRRKDSLSVLHLFAASFSQHPGALMSLAYRHLHGHGVPKHCNTAALFYVQVARDAAEMASRGIPTASEAIRLSLSSWQLGGTREYGKVNAHHSQLLLHVADSGDEAVQCAVGKKYLFGAEGFDQDFVLAVRYLRRAAESNRPEAVSYMGYAYALGLGVEKNLDIAAKYFKHAAHTFGDVIAHNGLGYLYFKGAPSLPSDISAAFYHFNVSASRGFPDAQYNIASLFLTGTGVRQSFPKAILWLTRAVEQGHTAAAYLLGILHLNGFGTIKDCSIAVGLLKRVAERHSWLSKSLQKAYKLLSHNRMDEAAFIFWRLAEAGHELSQSNLGHLLDGSGHTPLAGDYNGAGSDSLGLIRLMVNSLPTSVARKFVYTPTKLFSPGRESHVNLNRVMAQRYWKLAAGQGSGLAYVRLGDYAFHGWGTSLAVSPLPLPSSPRVTSSASQRRRELKANYGGLKDSDGEPLVDWVSVERRPFVDHRRQSPDYKEALENYEASTKVAQPGRASHLARAEFRIAQMHQWGLGVAQDFTVAKRHYERAKAVDPQQPTFSISFSIAVLRIHSFLSSFDSKMAIDRVLRETRFLALISLLYLYIFSTAAREITLNL